MKNDSALNNNAEMHQKQQDDSKWQLNSVYLP